MTHRRRSSGSSHDRSPTRPRLGGRLRIIGGRFRGRSLTYTGQLNTRPMKDRVREAAFGLIGPAVQHKHVLDLFAGTGALGLEAISRGAAKATLIERHFPTARIIQQNVAALGVGAQVEVVAGCAFFWARKRRPPPRPPWLVFCCPPYDYYVEQSEQMRQLVESLYQQAPAESVLVVEADGRFDVGQLPEADRWDVRRYRPAMIAIAHKD